jgi:hypothetical protein
MGTAKHANRGLPRLLTAGACLASMVLPVAATAAPRVTIKARIVPIPVNLNKPSGPKYPGTGAILGAGAALESELKISGTEYGGFPSPVTGIAVYLPTGTKLHPQGFPTCSLAILQSHEVQKCPKKSIAGAKGEVLGVVSFGTTRVPEKATLQAFFAPGGRLAFFVEGTSPTLIEVLTVGGFSTAPKPFGPKFSAEVPLVPTVPGAPYASVLSIKGILGAAYKQGQKLVPYGRVPKKCPKGGFPGKVELKYLSGETTTTLVTVPCPKR